MAWYNWILTIILFVIIPLGIGCLLILPRIVGCKGKNISKLDKRRVVKKTIKYILFYWILGAFHLCAIFNVLAWTFIFGGASMIIVFYNLANVFVSQVGTNKILNKLGLLQDFIVGLVITVYLIYIIPKGFEELRTIVTAVVAAVYGGLFTLVGVAWSIRKGDADRNAELLRIEKARKEEERKLHVPYLKVVVGVKAFETVNCHIVEPLNLDDEKSLMQVDNNTFYGINIDNFRVKNVSSQNILLQGIILDDKFYKFDNQQLIEANNVCQIQTNRNFEIEFAKPLKQFLICVEDIIGNKYTIGGKLNPDIIPYYNESLADNGKKYRKWFYKYKIENLSLPILVEEAANE